jgi:hypothetical protein
MNREGFYSIYYQGQAGLGVGMLVLDTNIVTGADPFGGRYDGTYQFNVQANSLDIDVVLRSRPALGWSAAGWLVRSLVNSASRRRSLADI